MFFCHGRVWGLDWTAVFVGVLLYLVEGVDDGDGIGSSGCGRYLRNVRVMTMEDGGEDVFYFTYDIHDLLF